MAPCHLAKQKDPDTHSNWSQQEANSVPILPQSASRHDAGGRNPHSNHLCRSTVRFGSKNRLQRSRKRGPRDAGALRVSFSLILGLGNTGMDAFRICLGCMEFGDAERWVHKWVLNRKTAGRSSRKPSSWGSISTIPPTSIRLGRVRRSSDPL